MFFKIDVSFSDFSRLGFVGRLASSAIYLSSSLALVSVSYFLSYSYKERFAALETISLPSRILLSFCLAYHFRCMIPLVVLMFLPFGVDESSVQLVVSARCV